MSNIIALDTANSFCTSALWCDERLTARSTHCPTSHSSWALSQIDELLTDAGIALGACDAVAFGAGPGSFTGLRVACGLAQGLAWGADLPVLPVGNLQALALQGAMETGLFMNAPVRVLALLDARLGEFYAAVYEGQVQSGQEHALPWRALLPPALIAPHDLSNWCASVWLTEPMVPKLVVIDSAISGMPDVPEAMVCRSSATASTVALIAAGNFACGGALPAAQAAPLYIRNDVAQTVAQRRDRAAAIGK